MKKGKTERDTGESVCVLERERERCVCLCLCVCKHLAIDGHIK